MAADPVSLVAVASIGNAVGIAVASMQSGPGAWVRRRVTAWRRCPKWLQQLLACPVCLAFWPATVVGCVAAAAGGGLELMAAGCVAVTVQFGIAAMARRQ